MHYALITQVGIVAYCVRWQQTLRHVLQQSKGCLPLQALLACTYGSIGPYCIRRQQTLRHSLQKSKGCLPLQALGRDTCPPTLLIIQCNTDMSCWLAFHEWHCVFYIRNVFLHAWRASVPAIHVSHVFVVATFCSFWIVSSLLLYVRTSALYCFRSLVKIFKYLFCVIEFLLIVRALFDTMFCNLFYEFAISRKMLFGRFVFVVYW